MEGLFSSALGSVGILVTIVTIIVEVLKGVLPKKIPTQILTIIVSLVVGVGGVLLYSEVNPKTIVLGIFSGFVTSFASMYGFDTLKGLVMRCKGEKDNE